MKNTIIFLMCLLLFVNCTNKTKQPKEEALWENPAKQTENIDTKTNDEKRILSETKAVQKTIENEDTTVYGFKDLKDKIKETPIMKGDPKTYFRENNKFKDWNINDKKEVGLEYIVEKNGSTSNIMVIKSSGNTNLDNEAVRLIKEAVHLPGTNYKGEPIRCGNTMINVYFPPK